MHYRLGRFGQLRKEVKKSLGIAVLTKKQKLMEHKLIESEHGPIQYWVSGEGNDYIVFTHGALMDGALFRYQLDFFKKDFTLITWDVPAHGRSRPYPHFSLKEAADRLIDILNQEEIKRVHLVGQSMGGYIAQIVAREYTERVKSITTIGSSPIQPRYYSKLDNWLLKLTPSVLRLYPYSLLVRTIARQVSAREEGRSYALQTLKKHSKSEIVNIMKEVYTGIQEYRDDKALGVPIYITYGEHDKTGKVQAYCTEWAKREHLPLEIIPHAAHNANMDNPLFFNRVLKNHLTRWDKE